MPNDAKLGLLAGVAGVIVTAVLFGHNPTPGGQAAPPRPPTAGAEAAPRLPTGGSGPPSSRGSPLSTPSPDAGEAVPIHGRSEPTGLPVSRSSAKDDD